VRARRPSTARDLAPSGARKGLPDHRVGLVETAWTSSQGALEGLPYKQTKTVAARDLQS